MALAGFGWMTSGRIQGQSKTQAPGTQQPDAQQSGTQQKAPADPTAPGAANGFSIETEMLTYRALESNGEAIACDIAAYLNGVDPTKSIFPAAPKLSKDAEKEAKQSADTTVVREVTPLCNVNAGASEDLVVILPFDKTQLADFQIWRADMATMARLQRQANAIVAANKPAPPTPPAQPTDAPKSGTMTAASSVLSLTPAGPPLALAQGVFDLLASEETSSSVGGTIQDQAYIDGVGRELTALQVNVLTPSAYAPGAMSELDEATSPFLASLARTLTALGNLTALHVTDEATTNSITETKAEIQAFLGTIGENAAADAKSKSDPAAVVAAAAQDPKTQTTTGTGANGAAAANGAPTQDAKKQSGAAPPPAAGAGAGAGAGTQTSSAAAATHLSSVLMADGLAVQLGVDVNTGRMKDGAVKAHILLLKALESGGSVTKNTNLLGTKIRYSGGSVGSFALYGAEGKLECSGNVYDYAGSLPARTFERDLQSELPDPGREMIFLHGSCRPRQKPPAVNTQEVK
jgi:hypothetical protein